jgi:hypothetical protein
MTETEPTLPAADVDPPKKRKKKHSKHVREWQRLDEAFADSAMDASRAVRKGVRTWRLESEKSQDKKKNGALKDAVRNWGKAYGKGVKVAADIPADFVDAWNPSLKRLKKLYRL